VDTLIVVALPITVKLPEIVKSPLIEPPLVVIDVFALLNAALAYTPEVTALFGLLLQHSLLLYLPVRMLN
jgi:hypothetical protein